MTYSAAHPSAHHVGRPRVLADVLPRGIARDIALVIGGACFVGLLAQISFHVSWTPVAYTLQTFGVLLVGASLGSLRGASSMAVYAVAGGLGVPWYSEHKHGFGGYTYGYIIGFIVAAAVVGFIAERGRDGATRNPLLVFAMMILGSVVIYAIGVPWLAHELGMSGSAAVKAGARPFLVLDAAKALVAAGLLPSVWKLVDRP